LDAAPDRAVRPLPTGGIDLFLPIAAITAPRATKKRLAVKFGAESARHNTVP
jgi:hypothetical protein